MLKEQLFILYKDEYVHSFTSDFHRLYGPINIFLKTTDTQIITNTIIKLGAITIGLDISAQFNQNFPYKEEIIALERKIFLTHLSPLVGLKNTTISLPEKQTYLLKRLAIY